MDVPTLVSAWDALVQQLAFAFTDATARTWEQIALGWVPLELALVQLRLLGTAKAVGETRELSLGRGAAGSDAAGVFGRATGFVHR